MIAVFVALEAEAQALLQAGKNRQDERLDGILISHVEYDGAEVLVCRTAIGERSRQLAAAALDAFSVDCSLSIGFAGGLDAELRAGDLIVCDRVDRAQAAASIFSDVRLVNLALQAASGAGLIARVGSALTVDRIIAGPEEKERLRLATGHDIVEMESYWVGAAALDRGLPFLAVRVVSDQAVDSLPDYVVEISGLVGGDGTVDYSKLAPYLERYPDDVQTFARLATCWQNAASSLTRFAGTYLPLASHLIANTGPAS